jgi:nitrate reductase gamma subunit
MFEAFTDRFFQWLHAVPAIFTEHGSPNFFLSRAMIGLILIVAIVCALALLPYRRMFDGTRRLLSRWRGTTKA